MPSWLWWLGIIVDRQPVGMPLQRILPVAVNGLTSGNSALIARAAQIVDLQPVLLRDAGGQLQLERCSGRRGAGREEFGFRGDGRRGRSRRSRCRCQCGQGGVPASRGGRAAGLLDVEHAAEGPPTPQAPSSVGLLSFTPTNSTVDPCPHANRDFGDLRAGAAPVGPSAHPTAMGRYCDTEAGDPIERGRKARGLREQRPTIIYTLTDGAPLLATYAFLPIIRTFAGPAGIDVQTSDISVRSAHPRRSLQRVPDNPTGRGPRHQHHAPGKRLGTQLTAADCRRSYAVHPSESGGDFAKCLGWCGQSLFCAEDSSDRRGKDGQGTRRTRTQLGEWVDGVAHPRRPYARRRLLRGEKSDDAGSATARSRWSWETAGGETMGAQTRDPRLDGDVVDSMFMSCKDLRDFYGQQMDGAYQTGVMFSLHVKATMMKVNHPIVFGPPKIFYKDAFAKHQELFDELGVNVNNGLSDLYEQDRDAAGLQARRDHLGPARCHEHRPELAMVDSARGASPTSTRRPTSSSTPPCRR